MNPFFPVSAGSQSDAPNAAVTLTIGLFFDGTGNNARNTRSRLEAGLPESDGARMASAKQVPGWRDRALTSHIGYYTNIHWLSTLYACDLPAEKGVIQQGIYIEGVGTEEGAADMAINMALGIGSRGIIAKTDKAIACIAGALRDYCARRADAPVISEVQFDLFGFSRGAAAARHFANRIFGQDRALVEAIKTGLAGVAYRGAPAGKTRFLGLFDTVAAVASLANGINPNSAHTGDVKLALRPGVAKSVFHITAQHECRFNFALNSVKPAWPELALPGVHSDIGGGYHAVEQEACFLTRPRDETVLHSQPDEATRTYRQASRELAALKNFPAIAPWVRNGCPAVATWSDDRMPPDRYGMLQKRSGAAVVIRRSVRNDWSKVALRVMIDAAQAAGVDFRAPGEALALPEALLALNEKALAMGQAVRHGRAVTGFTTAETDLLAANYLHCSANWNAVVTDGSGAIVSAVRPVDVVSYTNRPDRNWQRTVYNMDGNRVLF